jgi:hypothetical protein
MGQCLHVFIVVQGRSGRCRLMACARPVAPPRLPELRRRVAQHQKALARPQQKRHDRQSPFTPYDRSVPRPAKNGAPRPTWRNRRRARRRQSVNARSGRPECCNRTPSARSKQNWRLRPSIKRHFPSFSTSFSTVFSVFFQLCTRGGHWADGKGTQNGPFRSQALCPPEPTHRVRPDLAGRRSKVVTRRQAVHTMSSSTCGHSFTPWARRASRPQWFDRPARLHPPLETRHHAAI